jgi:hypothetical protein
VFAMVDKQTSKQGWELRVLEPVYCKEPVFDQLYFNDKLVASIYRNSRSMETMPKLVEELNKHNITIEVGANSENVTN